MDLVKGSRIGLRKSGSYRDENDKLVTFTEFNVVRWCTIGNQWTVIDTGRVIGRYDASPAKCYNTWINGCIDR